MDFAQIGTAEVFEFNAFPTPSYDWFDGETYLIEELDQFRDIEEAMTQL